MNPTERQAVEVESLERLAAMFEQWSAKHKEDAGAVTPGSYVEGWERGNGGAYAVAAQLLRQRIADYRV